MMNDLLGLVPDVLRARGWRLYTKTGRLVDLWQFGGRAVLGHKSPGLLRVFKNTAERGLFIPLPHFTQERFHKALSALLPQRSFVLYESEIFLNQALNAAVVQQSCLVQQSWTKQPVLWRPFLDKDSQTVLQAEPVLAPVLPCPFPGTPAVLALLPEEVMIAEKLPPSHLFAPVVLSAAARSIYDLLANPGRGNPYYPKTDKALKQTANWKRLGIYLHYTGKDYAALFRHFLKNGFLLPPSPEQPAILPGELSPGEEAKLAGLLL